MMLIGLILIGLAIYLLFNQKGTDVDPKTKQTIDPLETVKVRLARGEITIEDYEMIKKNLY
ncbi:SHOCT domain-containing protein [Bacillus sp. EB600]|uniref:SHOCT domain-containing protein n=1 Tax=Bacillus sp. EB600 TaxID=2806345 RepID=UPI002108ABB1|nr:SHOCT domain-containing protein [Bacillus sp. EB600]MCQ6280718.1 SHOCT domain-containing protein [Bacillus sp. EB600]